MNLSAKYDYGKYLPWMILLLSAAVRLYGLDSFGMWFDEAYSYLLAQEPISRIVELARVDNTPPVYHIILRWWIKLGAESDFMVRLPSVVFGVLSVWMAYLLGKYLFDKRTAVYSALICAFSFQLVHFSQEARMYSLQTLLGLLSTYYFVKALDSGKLSHLTIWAAANILGFYTQLFSLFLFGAQGLYFIVTWTKRNTPANVKLLLFSFITALGIFPWAPVLIYQMNAIESDYWVLPVRPVEILKVANHLFGGTDFNNRYLPALISNLPFAAAFAGGVYFLIKSRSYGNKFLLPLIIISPLAIAYCLSIGRKSVFFYRYFVFLTPYIYILTALGISSLRGKLSKILFPALLFVTMVIFLKYLYSDPVYSQPMRGPAREALTELKKYIGKNEPVVFLSTGNMAAAPFFTARRYLNNDFPMYIWRETPVPFYCGASLYKKEYALTDIKPISGSGKIWIYAARPIGKIRTKNNLPLFSEDRIDRMSEPAYSNRFKSIDDAREKEFQFNGFREMPWKSLEANGYSLITVRNIDNYVVICEFVKGAAK